MAHYEAIVIGVSAGGLAAVICLIKDLPKNYSLPIVIVQHRAKDEGQLLEQVLQETCKAKIKQADEKELIVKGYIYIAPPDYHLLIENDRTLSLSHDSLVHYSRPSIDVLFESAANVYTTSLIGIILTGANEDGAEGVLAIRNKGGLTIAQDPKEAAYPIMPQAAIDSGGVKYSWTIEKITDFILNIDEAKQS